MEGTGIGTSTNQDGKFKILKIPPRKYNMIVSFIGYAKREIEVDLLNEKNINIFVELIPTAIEGETVIVSDQAFGQAAAINQQLNSNTIKNIVSSERILELPDANSAEAVSHLPGISLIRGGGEGSKVVIRGLSPTYNSVSIEGIRIPGTDPSDRSVDLSIFSSEILSGIEVIKVITPDNDADSFGGLIEFKLAKATRSGFHSNLRIQTGYSSLRNDYGNYKGSWIFSNRFFNNKLGIVVAGHIEKKQSGFDSYRAVWEMQREKRTNEEYAPMFAAQVDLGYTLNERKRYGFNVLFDYDIANGGIYLRTFLNSKNDRISSQNINYYLTDARVGRHLNSSVTTTAMNSFALGGNHEISDFNIDWSASFSNSKINTPFQNSYGFMLAEAYDSKSLPEFPSANDLINAHTKDISNFFANSIDRTSLFAEEKENSYQMKIELPYTIKHSLGGKLKLGVKFRSNKKVRDDNRLSRSMYNWYDPQLLIHHSKFGSENFNFSYAPNGGISMLNYIDEPKNRIKILDGNYDFLANLSEFELNHLMNSFLLDSAMVIQRTGDINDYLVEENISAGFIMNEINFTQILKLLTGIRYEQTYSYLVGKRGIVPNEIIEYNYNQNPVVDTTATNFYYNLFPTFQLLYSPKDWCDIRLAYSEAISRPRMEWILPNVTINSSIFSVNVGNPELMPQTSQNIDAFLSFYTNELGLITIGGFYKFIKNLIYFRTGHKILNTTKEDVPSNWKGLSVNSPENNPNKTKVYGIECEWQSNLWWLPKPFNGLVVNLNYSRIWSKTHYPLSYIKNSPIPVFPFLLSSVIDTAREGKMPNQADNILNLSLGYDNGKFSGRISLLYQGKSLSFVGDRKELDGFISPITRLNFTFKYHFTKAIGAFFNITNILNTYDESYQQNENFISSKQYDGLTSDLGFFVEL
ncbi:MAG: TonB-dependent receptor [Bacteroidetes bacterium]|nr:TonB-dependent receptor [Bacteroidota bacterium]